MKLPNIEIFDTSQLVIFFQLHLLFYLTSCAWSQCQRGDEAQCIWTQDGRSQLRWIPKRESGENFIKLQDCDRQNCGSGIIESPPLPPSSTETHLSWGYKISGDSRVYLNLYQIITDQNLPKLLWSKKANYGDIYPTTWSPMLVVVPATSASYRLMLKAYTPYNGALVSVRGILVEGSDVRPSTSTTQRTTPRTTPSTTPSTTTTQSNNPVFPDDDNSIDGPDQTQALEGNDFAGVEDLTKGYTTVVTPNLCRYS